MPAPPDLVLFVNAKDPSRHTSSATTSLSPVLGLLTLMSALRGKPGTEGIRLGYLDGVVHGNETIEEFIDEHAPRIRAVCFSTLTANYDASIAMTQRLKERNPHALVLLGSDHFSALYEGIMRRQPTVDFGFSGHDIVPGFTDFMADSLRGALKDPATYPGLVYRAADGTVEKAPESPAWHATPPLIDYSLTETLLPHQELYQ